MHIPRIVIAGEKSGIGKSTITVGILLALKERGLLPQPFKAGPDFLDPMHHSVVLDKYSRNLDTWMFPDSIKELFIRASKGADISVIEGVMGFYDGVDGINEEGSTAHLSKILKAPVVLILDARGSARSIGAVAKGFKEYDEDVDIAGVIFNNVGSRRHLRFLEDSLRGIESLGGIPRVDDIELKSRHLGLVFAKEELNIEKYDKIRILIEENLDIKRLIKIANGVEELCLPESSIFGRSASQARVGVAFDSAFNFYYHDNFEILKSYGAEVSFFSPLSDKLPDVDGIYLGGGYPELFAQKLEKNKNIKKDIKNRSLDEMPIYGECGGLMYLCKGVIDFDNNKHNMAGIFDAEVEMTEKLQALSYVEAIVQKNNPLSLKGTRFRGHEFHYSKVGLSNEEEYVYKILRGRGITDLKDGFISKNTLASYTHLHFASCPTFAKNFVKSCAEYQKK